MRWVGNWRWDGDERMYVEEVRVWYLCEKREGEKDMSGEGRWVARCVRGEFVEMRRTWMIVKMGEVKYV